MVNLSNLFSKALATTIKGSFDALNAAQRYLDEFDVKKVMENDYLGRITKFFYDVKDSVTAFKIKLKIDKPNDTIDLSVEGNVLTITIDSRGEGSHKKTVNSITIPEDCDTDRMYHTVNEKDLTATIVIPKKSNGELITPEVQEKIQAAREKAKKTVKYISKAIGEVLEDKVEVEDEVAEDKVAEEAPKQQPKKPIQRGTRRTTKKPISRKGSGTTKTRRTNKEK